MTARGLPALSQVSAVFTAGSELFSDLYEQNRLTVPLGAMSHSVIHAVIAVEDRRFYRHCGVDWRGVARAAVVNVQRRRIVQGGSTITQQVSRAAFLKRFDRTLSRKVLEILTAYLIEFRFTKDEILEMYLNCAYFGHGIFGVEVAALTYFGKTAADVDEEEAAYLAGLLRAPSRYCLCCHPHSAHERTTRVLRIMGEVQRHGIAPRVRSKPVKCHRRKREMISTEFPLTGGYALDCVRQFLRKDFGHLYPSAALKVHSTLDTHCQHAVEAVCSETTRSGYDGRLACIVQDARSGAIRALTGGAAWQSQQFNAAQNGKLQPGSLLKPFILMAALQSGMSLGQKFSSKPLRLQVGATKPWTVRNAGDRYFGLMSVEDALVVSDNAVFAQLLLAVGLEPVRQLLRSVGIRLASVTPALSVGAVSPGISPLQLCASYSVFSSRGQYFPPKVITEVVAAGGSVATSQQSGVHVCTPDIAEAITSVLRRVTLEGTGRLWHDRSNLASKTGTSISGGWYASYDESYRVLTWTESDFLPAEIRSHPSKGVSAKALADRIWGYLHGPRVSFSSLFGALAGVDEMPLTDLLWVEREFQQ